MHGEWGIDHSLFFDRMGKTSICISYHHKSPLDVIKKSPWQKKEQTTTTKSLLFPLSFFRAGNQSENVPIRHTGTTSWRTTLPSDLHTVVCSSFRHPPHWLHLLASSHVSLLFGLRCLCGGDGLAGALTTLAAVEVGVDDVGALLNDLLALGEDHLNVAGVGHVRVDLEKEQSQRLLSVGGDDERIGKTYTTVCTVCAAALLGGLVDLDVLDNEVGSVKTLGVGVGLGVLEEREKELCALDGPAGLGDTELLAWVCSVFFSFSSCLSQCPEYVSQ